MKDKGLRFSGGIAGNVEGFVRLDKEARVTIFSREDGQRASVSFPLDHDLEYCAQELLYRFGSTRTLSTLLWQELKGET
ncbi:hypothetical protein SAMN05216417_11430 [Nitrosospira multiformis]|uniref:Uncharacterized protein n=1 Tax=Nitrosospira multiformis TaxID=1231 RepID=A0A1I7I416_9PROT|nr:hypothetical protein SAMN05216417_11430 [Nitrosospira multiformis]